MSPLRDRLGEREAPEQHAAQRLFVGRDDEFRVATWVVEAQFRLFTPEDQPIDLRVLGELEADRQRRPR